MNKALKVMAMVSLLSSSLFAEIVFNLEEQHFSKAIEGTYESARYELTDAYVSTNLKYIEGVYLSDDSTGKFNVELKEPIESWSVSFDVWFYLSSKRRFIKLVDENGESAVVSFKSKDINFDNKSVVSDLYSGERLTVGLLKNGDDIELSINGSKVGTATKASFSKLKYIETGLIVFSNNLYDTLNSLTIGSK